eukprot:m.210427 g.210427  ORF g.210427 m.210427 type:complete len:69 (+) comp15050_c0_seq24:1590-1796(+)
MLPELFNLTPLFLVVLFGCTLMTTYYSNTGQVSVDYMGCCDWCLVLVRHPGCSAQAKGNTSRTHSQET